jgi:hypothetical protein
MNTTEKEEDDGSNSLSRKVITPSDKLNTHVSHELAQ